jgi:hypothetical protein
MKYLNKDDDPSSSNSNQTLLSVEDERQLGNERKRLFIVTAALSIICGIIISVSGAQVRIIFTNLPETISSGFALIFSVIFLLLHLRLRNAKEEKEGGKKYNNKGKTSSSSQLPSIPLSTPYKNKVHIPFTIGLALWFTAELVYSYYQIVLKIEVPFPSVADPVFLIGYGFFAYSFYMVLRYMKRLVDREVIVFVSLAVCTSLSFILYLSMGIGQLMVPVTDQLSNILSITYPVLDGVLFVPALVILWSINRTSIQENLVFTHWVFVSAFIILNAIGDVGYGYNVIVGSINENEWIWDIFYNAAYITIAAALFWQVRNYRFLSELIQSKEKVQREGQAKTKGSISVQNIAGEIKGGNSNQQYDI